MQRTARPAKQFLKIESGMQMDLIRESIGLTHATAGVVCVFAQEIEAQVNALIVKVLPCPTPVASERGVGVIGSIVGGGVGADGSGASGHRDQGNDFLAHADSPGTAVQRLE
jgi:hypothetical protein